MTAQESLGQVVALPYPLGAARVVASARRWARLSLARHQPWQTSARVSDDPTATGGHTSERPATPAGPDAAYEAFIREHQRPLLNYLWRMTGDEQSAYDLAQEVFVRAWRHFAKLRGYDRPSAWLFRVATNLALTDLAARKTTLTSFDALGAELEPVASDPAWRVAERDLVRAALDGLPPRRRAALTLREVYGLSCAEVAQALGVSDAAARMTLSRAREQFRALYLREGGDEHDA
jgi:RNA polymerase sigma-70 factor (ECF subfamily)